MSPFDIAALMLVLGFAIGALSIGAAHWMRRFLSLQSRPLGNDDARDLAMRTVLSLDDLVGACYAAVHDFPEFDPEDPSVFVLHAEDPVLVLPKDVNWSLLGRDLSDEIRWLPNRLRNVVDALQSIEIDPPEFNDLFEHRQDDFSRIGLRAMDLIERLCATYDLSLPERPAYYQPRENFTTKVREMEKLWKRRAESARQVPSEPSNITSIFGGGVAPGEHSR